LPVSYFHVVSTVSGQIESSALQNKKVVHTILFHATAETFRRIAADPKHLGARIGFLAVLHSCRPEQDLSSLQRSPAFRRRSIHFLAGGAPL
jgi:hypothetical protein